MAQPTLRACHFTSIEPLEARIAPALLVNGANLLGGSSPSTGETSVGDHSVLLVKVLSGQALVWYNGSEITGISVGPGANLEIHGNIDGNIVGNLTASGQLSDSDNNPANGRDGDVLLPNNIVGIKTFPLSGQAGNVDNIITGGAISNVTIAGSIDGIYAGDGVFRAESSIGGTGTVVSSLTEIQPVPFPPIFIDINPVQPGVQPDFNLTKSAGVFVAGASIHNVSVTNAEALEMYAGDGGPTGSVATGKGPGGGSILGVTIENAFVPAGAPLNTPAYHLLAGNGEDGKTGGAGGSVVDVVEKSSFGPVIIVGGQGGAGHGGAGGAGGNVSNLDLQSASSRYSVTAGDGGTGTPGGAGGRSMNNNFSNRTPVAGVILSGDFTGDGIDDVLVADAGSGQMVISTQDDNDPFTAGIQGNGTDFVPLVQFKNGSAETVAINAAGSTPIAAIAADVNGDGKLDIVVAYKNSGSLGVFINQGHGSFYDTGADAFASTSVALGFTPQTLTALDGNGTLLAISENNGGHGMLHLAQSSAATGGGTTYTVDARVNTFNTTIADVVPGYVGLTNGTISNYVVNDLQAKNPFLATDIGVAISGGIDDLDLDQTGSRLLALSAQAHTLTVLDLTTSATSPALIATLDLKTLPGSPLIAHFTHDNDAQTEDDIVVLTAPKTGSELAVFNPVAPDADPNTVDPGYTLGTTFTSSALLKNFVPVYGQAEVGIAALASSLSQFTFINGFLSSQDFSLPFASKNVDVSGGHGGDGVDTATVLGKGGVGGAIIGLNADAQNITLHAGDGGDSQNGPAGAGGAISNPATFVTTSGLTVSPTLLADASLTVTAGHGGTPQGAGGKTAAGGAGGSISGISATLTSGDILLNAGDGGAGKGGAGGAGGSVNGATTIDQDGNLFVTAGAGGDAPSGVAASGAGGSITNLTHTLTLDPDVESLEKSYSVTLTAGDAGTSAGGLGGTGGSLSSITLTLDGADTTDDPNASPAVVDAHRDSTVRVIATAGAGGNGARGGLGGSIRDFSSESVFDQITKQNNVIINYVVMSLTAGRGGTASAGNGGAGGSIMLGHPISGVTQWDPDSLNDSTGTVFDPSVPALVVAGGQGGAGTVKGGVGGGIVGLVAQNSAYVTGDPLTGTHLFSAVVTAGDGGTGGSGDGGLGGSIGGSLLGVSGGFLQVTAGTGGDSASTKGGAGGAIQGSEFGLVSSAFVVGMSITSGDGGAGKTGGGAGGLVSHLVINTPESTSGFSALVFAGSGGNANSAVGIGGRGGDVNGIAQNKDVNSSINVIEAGNGGDNPQGRGGAGGNVLNVNTVGFIGRPSDDQFNNLGVFDTVGSLTIAQGIFSGRGGTGTTAGVNGSVQNIVAQQIAAIAAAPDLVTGLFAVASRVAKVNADLIGFDQNGNGTFDDSNGGAPDSPSAVRAIDGFILASAIASVNGQRAGFVFNS